MNYKFIRFFLIGLAVLAVVFFLIVDREELPQTNTSQEEQSANIVQPLWETKSDEQLAVTVTVTPVALGERVDIWKFQIILDTHSGSLDDNLMNVVVLTDDRGTSFSPIAWEGSEPGGHHREGVLLFDAIDPLPSYIELIVKEVGGVPARSFRWDLQY